MDRGKPAKTVIGPIIRGMILKKNLMQNYRDIRQQPTAVYRFRRGGVKSVPPNTENSLQHGHDENHNYDMSDETKCETNCSIKNKWNNTHSKHLTKHDTNDDVDFDNCVVHTVR